jgi:hypothetical protein
MEAADSSELPVIFYQITRHYISETSGLNIHYCKHGWIKGWACQAAARGPKLWGALRHHWNNRKYGATKLRILHVKKFLWKLSVVWACTSLVLGLKSLKNIGFKGHQIINLYWAPTCLRLGLAVRIQILWWWWWWWWIDDDDFVQTTYSVICHSGIQGSDNVSSSTTDDCS